MKGRLSSMHKADVSVEDQVRTMIENVVRKHGRIDVVSLFRSISHSLTKTDIFR